MALVTQRVAGQLLQTDDGTQPPQGQQQAVGLGGAPASTTPVGTAAQPGATPQQAAMAGTPNQKTPVLDKAVSQQDLLSTAQRDATPAGNATATDGAAAAKAQQLQQLGSLSTRVEALIQKQLTLSSPAAGEVDQNQINTLSPELRAQAQTLMQAMVANPNDATAVARAANFAVANKMVDSVENFDPTKYIGDVNKSLADSAAQQAATVPTLDKLNLAPNEVTALTSVFGNDSWKSLTPQQLSQHIEDMRQSEFSRVKGLRAELASATGTQREEILQALKEAGAAGVTGVEASVKDVADQVAKGDTVTIGGEQHKVEDILKDTQLSDLVTRMLSDKDLMAKVAADPNTAAFAKWVTDNQKTLGQLATQVAGTSATVKSIYQQKTELATVAPGVTISDRVMKYVVPGWGQATTSLPDVSHIGFLQALKDPNLSTAQKASMNTALDSVSTDPKLLAQVSSMSAVDFKKAFDSAQQVQNDPLLEQLTGLTGSDKLVLDPKQAALISRYSGITSSLQQAVAAAPKGSTLASAVQDPVMVNAIKNGDFKASDVAALAKAPDPEGVMRAYADYHVKRQGLEAALNSGDYGKILDYAFGGKHVDPAAIANEYNQLQIMVKNDPSNAEARSRLAQLQALDTNHDGSLDKRDRASLFNALSVDIGGSTKALSLRDVIGGARTTGSLMDTFAKNGLDTNANVHDTSVGAFLKAHPTPTTTDLETLSDSERLALWNMPAAWQQTHKVPSQQQYQAAENDKKNATAADTAQKQVDDQLQGAGIDPGSVKAVISGDSSKLPDNIKDLAAWIQKGQALVQSMTAFANDKSNDAYATSAARDKANQIRDYFLYYAKKKMDTLQQQQTTASNAYHAPLGSVADNLVGYNG